MDKKTSRFLLFEAALLIFAFFLSQFFPYPIPGKAGLDPLVEKYDELFDQRLVVKADLETSVMYILEINEQYCEKLFDKSLIFERYIERPLVLLRKTDAHQDAQFVARDSAQSHMYALNDKEELVIYKQTGNELFTIAYVIFGGTLILLGLCFGTGRKKPGAA